MNAPLFYGRAAFFGGIFHGLWSTRRGGGRRGGQSCGVEVSATSAVVLDGVHRATRKVGGG